MAKEKTPSFPHNTYVVDMDLENREVRFTVESVTKVNNLPSTKTYAQTYNLDLVPLDAVMSQICGIIVPRPQQQR